MRISSIGRPIDPKHPTNLAILVVTGVVFVLASVYTWVDGSLDVAWAGSVAVAGFMAWAITRELAPDHPLAAFVSTAIMVGLSPLAVPSLVLSFWALLVIRILNQSPGTPTLMDGFLTIVLSLWASYQGFWITGPLTAVAFVADSWLPKPTDRWKFAAIPLLGLFLAWPIAFSWQPSLVHGAILFALPLLLTRRVQSRCDRGTPLHITRLHFAAAMAALMVWMEPVAGGAMAAALMGAGFWVTARWIRALRN